MLNALNSRLTYANVMATVAVFLALGGGAYALSGIPDRGGVFHGCVNNATGVLRVVKSAHSCQRAKTVRRNGKNVRLPGAFAVAWNKQGLQGLQGIQGIQGIQGQKGDTGATGPSDIRAVGVGAVNINNSNPTIVASLTVPAGSYWLGASLAASRTSAMGTSTSVGCSMQEGDPSTPTTVWDGKNTSQLNDTSTQDNLTLAGADTFNVATTINLVCTQGAAVQVTNIRLWAISTGALHATLPLPIAG
jgi:hypothetical protein